MANHNFGEEKEVYDPQSKTKIPVMITPKYKAARDKAIEVIEKGDFGLTDSDFWILQNATKSRDKMMYTGLIISHNGCLKINDKLEKKFNPSCLSLDKDGYRNSLVYSYCNAEQGLFEVGEVNSDNLKQIAYPYAMALKRCFDRVVLKLSKLAYAGIMSDSESEEFAQPEQKEQPKQEEQKKYDNPEDEPFDTAQPVQKPKTENLSEEKLAAFNATLDKMYDKLGKTKVCETLIKYGVINVDENGHVPAIGKNTSIAVFNELKDMINAK